MCIFTQQHVSNKTAHLGTCHPHSEVIWGPPRDLNHPVPAPPGRGVTRYLMQAHLGPLRDVRTRQTGVHPVPTAPFLSEPHYHTLLYHHIPPDHQFCLPRSQLPLTSIIPPRNRV